MRRWSAENSAFVAELADAAGVIAAAQNLSGIAAASVRCVGRMFTCAAVSFAAFDLQSCQPLLEEHLSPLDAAQFHPRLNRSRDLAAALKAGAEILAVANESEDEYYTLTEAAPATGCGRCELRIPFQLGEGCLCVLSLGQKRDGAIYGGDEINALRILVGLLERSRGVSPADPCPPLPIPSPVAAGAEVEELPPLLGSSPVFLAIRAMIERVAPTEAAVLITGESGTGKELVARAIHQQSQHASRDMIILNCAALPESLVESELFGHERGAFTGALCRKSGKFELADHSTLFLDEIGDLSLPVQAKLLRFLQDGVFQRLGGTQNLRSRIRLIAATNKMLPRLIEAGLFREDLYYRINVVEIVMPPLRERREDIITLTDYYARFFAQKYGKSTQPLHPQIIAWLHDYGFPGNIRELKNIVERAVILGHYAAHSRPDSQNAAMAPAGPALPSPDRAGAPTESAAPAAERAAPAVHPPGPADASAAPAAGAMPVPAPNSPARSLEELEKEHIRQILRQTMYNKTAAARILGIARKTLRLKMARYQLDEAAVAEPGGTKGTTLRA